MNLKNECGRRNRTPLQTPVICMNTVVVTPHSVIPGSRQAVLFGKMSARLADGVATLPRRGKGENDKSLLGY